MPRAPPTISHPYIFMLRGDRATASRCEDSGAESAFGMHTSVSMGKPPTRYDEIHRATVPRVDMFREVRGPREHTGPERELAERVRIALASDARLDAHRIEVSAHGSRIRLTGVIPSTSEWRRRLAASPTPRGRLECNRSDPLWRRERAT